METRRAPGPVQVIQINSVSAAPFAWSPIPGDQRLAIIHERKGEERLSRAVIDPETAGKLTATTIRSSG
jgi:hypothetical protein